MTTRRLAVLPVLLSLALALALAAPAAATSGDRRVLQGYAADTRRSFELLLDLDHRAAVRQRQRRRRSQPLHLPDQCRRLPGAPWPLATPGSSPCPRPASGSRPPWPAWPGWSATSPAACSTTGTTWPLAKLTTWPVDGSPVYPFLSSVDNGWMAAALLMVSNAVPELRDQARALLAPMDFGYYYDPAAGSFRRRSGRPAGHPVHHRRQLPRRRPRRALHLPPLRRPQHRAAHRQLPWHRLRPGPATHYFPMSRTFPPTCDWGWQEQQPAASPAPTWASRCSRATTATAAWTSCPAGAGACSRP